MDKENLCHDCGTAIVFEGREIKNGVFLRYENGAKKYDAFKCAACYAKDKSLADFQPCEVYSRVVGYLRPVQSWNQGKQQEYKERKEYKNS